jgi:hypothetical protein
MRRVGNHGNNGSERRGEKEMSKLKTTLVFVSFALGFALTDVATSIWIAHAQEKPKQPTPAAPTIESLQKDIVAKDQMLNWLNSKNSQLEAQINGLQGYCNATIILKQLDQNKPQPPAPSASAPPAAPAVPETKK